MSNIDISQFPETVAAMGGNAQRATVFLDRYSDKDDSGNPVERVPSELWHRVANAIGDTDEERFLFRNLMADFGFVPGGRIMAMKAGAETTAYNCYVVPIETRLRRAKRANPAVGGTDPGNDSREAIIDTVGVMVDILSRGGGVGVNWSVLRPKGAYLKRLNGSSSGPIDWMHMASTAVGTVEQGGSRRGAAMFMLDDWHPDVLDFIDSKRDLTRITNANVSVAVSDRFMAQVESDGDWTLGFPDTTDPHYDDEWDGDANGWLAKGYRWKSYQTVKARDLWRQLAQAAWDNGEPGVVFLDRYNEQSTAAGVERIICVNPCGEQGLGAYSVCNLGAMNLAKYVTEPLPVINPTYPATVTGHQPLFRWDAFTADVKTAVRFLDRVIDKNYYFLPENEKVQKDLRRIGLSVMGLADALIALGIRYGSPEAVRFTEGVFRTMKDVAIETSMDLADEFGPAPAWDDSMWRRPYLAEYVSRNHPPGLPSTHPGRPLRNLFLLTQAPTGTTSIVAGVNSGIEPLFALGYWREDRTGKHWVEPEAVKQWRSDHGHPKEAGPLPDYITKAIAPEVTVEEHVEMQAAVQRYVDSSVSKTINAPNSHTVEGVEEAYTLAYERGLKGLAYFRDGCGRAQVLSTETATDDDEEARLSLQDVAELTASMKSDLDDALEELALARTAIEERERGFLRPDTLTGRTHKVRAGQVTAYVTVNRYVALGEDKPVEVLVNAGKAGTDLMAMGEALGRLASLGLQKGLTLDDLVDQLEGVGNDGMLNRSLPSAIAFALKADVQAEAEAAAKFHEFTSRSAGRGRSITIDTPDATYEGRLVDLVITSKAEVTSPDGETIDISGIVHDLGVKPAVDETRPSVLSTPMVDWEAEFEMRKVEEPSPVLSADLCPECGTQALIRTEGCKKCLSCAYSAC